MSAQSIQSQISQGQGRRKSAEAAAKKSIRLQNAGTKKPKGRRSAARSSARKSAGQKSLTRKGIGCVIKILKQRSAKSLGKALRYASEGDTNQLIFSNCGHDNASQEAIMSAVVSQRSAVKTPIGHIMISPSNTSGLDESRLTELSEFALDELGIDRSLYASTVYLHKDETSTNHLHVTYARVGYDGSLHSSDNIAFLAMTVCEKIENRFNLKRTLREDKNKGRTPPTQGQLAEFRRTSVPSKTMQLQDGIDQAMDGAKDINEFQKRLALIGIDAQFNVQQKNGKPHCAGLVYAFSDGSFKASATALGSRYGLWSLKKRNLVYDPNQSASTTISSSDAPSRQPINVGQNNGVTEIERTRPVSNDAIRDDAPHQKPARDGTGNSSSAPAEQTLNSNERRKHKRTAERAANQPLPNFSNNRDVFSGAGRDDMAKIKEAIAEKNKAWEVAETKRAENEKREQLQKRFDDCQQFKNERFRMNLSSDSSIKFKHLMANTVTRIDKEHIADKESEAVKILLSDGRSENEIETMLHSNSLLHRPIQRPIMLNANAPEAVVEMAKRVEAEREEIIKSAKAAVEKAAKGLSEFRKLNPSPNTSSDWKPPEIS